MTAVLHDVSSRVPLTKARRDDGPAEEGDGNLSTVRVTGDSQGDELRNLRENVRAVCHHDLRIGSPANHSQVGFVGPQICEAGDGQTMATTDVHGIHFVSQHADAVCFERSANSFPIEPSVVVSENGIGRDAWPQSGKRGRHSFRLHERTARDTLDDVIAKQENEVRARAIRSFHEAAERTFRDERGPAVKVRNQSDPHRRQPGGFQVDFPDRKSGRLDHQCVEGKPGCGQNKDPRDTAPTTHS
jgi:hypothetical protein